MFDLRPDTGFKPLDLAGQAAQFIVWESLQLTALQGEMPVDCAIRMFLKLADPGVAGIGIYPAFLAMQQFAGHDHIADIGRRADCRVNQPGGGIDADVHLHPEVPVVALLGRVHVGVALLTLVLGRGRSGNQGGIYDTYLYFQNGAVVRSIVNATGKCSRLQ